MRNYLVIWAPKRFSFRRGQEKPIRVTIMNLSHTDWENPLIDDHKRGPQGSVALMLDQKSKGTFRLHFIRGGRSQPIYKNVYRTVPHVVKRFWPVHLTMYPQIENPLPAGRYDMYLKFGYANWTTPFQESNELRIRVKVKPAISRWDDFRLWFKLTFKQPGRIEEEFSNASFDKLNEKSGYQPVVMAVWSRPEYLGTTIQSLEKQKSSNPILYLWVNNKDALAEVRKQIVKTKLPVKVFVSAWNIGGFGRFYAARKIQPDFKSIIFIDDDQIPSPDSIASLVDEHKDGQVWGQFAHTFKNRQYYWDKNYELKVGEKATYIGTCGMIINSDIFTNNKLFRCPKRYWFVEDLWLSWFAMKHYKLSLKKSSAKIETVKDSKDQFGRLIDHKNDFFRYLVKKDLLEL